MSALEAIPLLRRFCTDISFLPVHPSDRVDAPCLCRWQTYTSAPSPLSLSREDTIDDFAFIFLNFSLFSTALWDLENSWAVNSLMFSLLFFCLSCLLLLFTVSRKMVLARPDERETCWYVCCLARTGCWTGRDGRTAPLLEYSHFPGLVHWVPAATPQLQLKHVVTAETSQHVDNREHRPTAAKRARYT